MQTPLEITFRDMSPSPALVATIDAWVRKLDEVTPLNRCAVVVEKPHKRRRHGAPFAIHLDITIPGHEIVVSRDRQSPKNPYIAVADAFRAARRQLKDFVTQRRDARPAI